MATSLSDMFKLQIGGFPPPAMNVSHTTPMTNVQRTLPNGGGSFFSPAPAQPTKPAALAQAPVQTQASAPSGPSINPAYMDKNGGLLAPGDVVNNLASTQKPSPMGPQPGAGDIPTYAGDALTQGPQTTPQLETTAAGLNNARNDIATGTTDPYKAATASGVAYSPAELKAIESAYAGVYDPAINSALSKLDTKQKADAAKLADQSWADKQVFQTNENIRQWRATTGLNASGDGSTLSNAKVNSGATNSGLSVSTFKTLDPDVQNFYANPVSETDPVTGKKYYQKDILKGLLSKVSGGAMTKEEATQEIMNTETSPAVQQYYLDQLPGIDATVKEGILSQIWNAPGRIANWATGTQ